MPTRELHWLNQGIIRDRVNKICMNPVEIKVVVFVFLRIDMNVSTCLAKIIHLAW
jgi:hypothetical protein